MRLGVGGDGLVERTASRNGKRGGHVRSTAPPLPHSPVGALVPRSDEGVAAMRATGAHV